MTDRELLRADSVTPAALGKSRSRVLTVLQDADRPVVVGEVAELVRLHPNTTRFHLDALVEADLAQRVTEQRTVPGRPRNFYTASPNSARSGRRSYRLLAEMLTGYVGAQTPQPVKGIQKAGDAWGRYLADRPAPFQRVDAAAATRQLVQTLEDIGFAPEALITGRKRQILLHHCPFREAAEAHPEVVCTLHLGLMQGLLAELDAPLGAERLDPFVQPSLCVTHLVVRKSTPPTAPRRSA